jgi:sialate O-acetylesterase
MKRTVNIAISITICILLIGPPARADVSVPTIFGDNMVLQRDVAVPVWGQAAAGEKVTVSLCDASASTIADKDGSWSVKLPAMKCTARQTGAAMTITGKNTITLKNILIGEVWVGSGQSNMEWQLRRSTGGKETIAKADLPNIRLYHVPKTQSKTPTKDIKAAWKVCSPETCPNFSAVLFFFGKRLHDDLNIPIGLINSSWGGSPIEPWTVTDASKKQGGGMYNAMIAPLQPFPIRGAIWYQGETNVIHKNGLKYFDKKKALIEGWRKTWCNDKLSFYTVQIAPWSGKRYAPGELPKLWEAQVASLKLPHTGLAVITDLVDNIRDIHPQNKLPVGNRLALWALAKDYGKKNLVYSGPLYKSMKIEGKKIRVSFAHVADGLTSRDGKALNEFQIAGADGKFLPAQAVIEGKTVVVSADGVTAPKNVRFGWHKLANPNLINKAKLPASPFQTDNWTGGTGQ